MNKGALSVAAAGMLWGTLGIFGVVLNRNGFSGPQVAVLRIVCSAVCLLVLLPFVARYLSSLRTQWLLAVAHSIFGVLCYNVTYFMAVDRLGPAYAVSLLYTAPIWVLLLGALFLGERLTVLRAVLATLAFLGVVCLVGSSAEAGPLGWAGVTAGLASGFFYALYAVMGKRLLRDIHPTAVLFTSFIVSALAVCLWPLTWGAVDQLATTAGPAVWFALFAISALGTVFSYFLFTRGLRWIPASNGAVLTTLEPFTAVVLAYVLFDERLRAVQWLGLLLILGCGVFSARLRLSTNLADVR